MFPERFVWAAVVFGSAIAAVAQEPPAESPEFRQQWLELRQAEFEAYEIEQQAEKPRKLAIEPRSILNWSNAERGAALGAAFLWTEEGRPQLIACAFGRGKLLRHEFHSLSTDELVARRDGEELHRFAPGIEWQELKDAPPPAKQRALRLTQMRRQAERFRVVMGGKEPAEMRLLTQPVFRSPAELADDVALFVFVQGTDPECALLVQATAEGKWQYALTRQTKWPLKVELDGSQVADYPSIGKTPPGSPFVVLTPPSAVE
jgi:hypothetical protein